MESSPGKIVIAGGSGFIGREMGSYLAQRGYEMHVLTRDGKLWADGAPFPAQVHSWQDPVPKLTAMLEGSSGLINLCGAGIADRRWTSARKRELARSRQEPIALLAKLVDGCQKKPRVWVQASAIGYYGDRADVLCTESSEPGTGFLAATCLEWENALAVVPRGMRQVVLRLGMVLGAGGGFLDKMSLLYAGRVAARLGGGEHWLSFIHCHDLCRLLEHCLEDERYVGPVNAVAPRPAQFKEFHAAMSRYFGRPLVPPVPRLAVRLALGEMAELALASQRVLPGVAQKMGFSWHFASVEAALAELLELAGARGSSGLRLVSALWLDTAYSEVWDFFASATNLEAMTPPWLHFHTVTAPTGGLGEGATIDYRLSLHGLPLRWRSEIRRWNPPVEFIDAQKKGPYALWHHRHHFIALPRGVIVSDRVDFRLPWHPLSYPLIGRLVHGDLKRIFAFRRAALNARFPSGIGGANSPVSLEL